MANLVQNQDMRKPVNTFTHEYVSKISSQRIAEMPKEVTPTVVEILNAMINLKYPASMSTVFTDSEDLANIENGLGTMESEEEPVESSQQSFLQSERSDQSPTHRTRELMHIM